jgi:hypothetical protein
VADCGIVAHNREDFVTLDREQRAIVGSERGSCETSGGPKRSAPAGLASANSANSANMISGIATAGWAISRPLRGCLELEVALRLEPSLTGAA